MGSFSRDWHLHTPYSSISLAWRARLLQQQQPLGSHKNFPHLFLMMCVRYIIVHGGPCHLQTFSTRAAPRLVSPRLASARRCVSPQSQNAAAFHVATLKRPLTLSSSASERIFNAQDMTFIHSSLKINKGHAFLTLIILVIGTVSKKWQQLK